jgi:hypothetical protein
LFVGLGTAVTCANTGAKVSIPFTVIVKFTVLFSLSLICTTQLSLHVWFAFGVYVIISHATLHIHFVHCVTIPLYVIFQFQHDHSCAFDNVFQSHVFAIFPIFVQYVKLLAVGATLLNVYVAVFKLLFHNASLTHHVLTCVPGCCAVILVVVVVLRVVPLKLYAVLCNHTHASLAAVIAKLHATHSFPFAFANVNGGSCLSILICDHVFTVSAFHAVSVL